MKHPQIPLLTLFAALLLAILPSCGSSSGPDEPDEPAPETPTRSVLVYMAANNNLSYYARLDLDEIKEGAKDISGGKMLVYYHRSDQSPRLIEITPDGEEKTLKTYDTAESSVSIARMRQVIADARSIDTSGKLGLIFWSHGTGWLSDTGSIDEDLSKAPAASPYSFGVDEQNGTKHKMKITSLRRALEGNTYDFIYFDCCHMATVEVAYELRKLTSQIAACPTELGLEGMPYDKNLKHFFAAVPDLDAAIRNSYDFYVAQGTNGCCISVIKTAGLDELARYSREALKVGALPEDYDPVLYYRSSIMRSGIYDMNHYFDALLRTKDTALLNGWKAAYAKVVSKSYTTPRVYGLVANDFSGLGCNILAPFNTADKYGYDETAWYRDVVAP